VSYARIIVERDAIDKGEPNPIRLERVQRDGTVDLIGVGTKVACAGHATVIYAPDTPLADGTRVWVEADSAALVESA
jgi:hypothetical protein